MNPFRQILKMAFLPCLAVLLIAALASSANAQITSAQQGAIKQSCRSDFMAKCSGVSPGGQEALACLQKNVAGLSPACQSAVSSTMPAAPPAAAKPAAKTVAKTAAVAAAPATIATAPAAAATVAVVAGPTPQQLSAVKHTCGRDFKVHCKGVPPGGPEALACLQLHAAKLAPDCKISLADIGDAVPVAAVTPVVVPAAVPAARPRPPGITPAGRIIRRVMEHN